MPHREAISEYLSNLDVHGLVYDWGSGTKPVEKKLKANTATFFKIDKLDHVGADRVMDMTNFVNFYSPADYAFCIEVIEHVWQTKTLLQNIHRNLKSDGILYLSQPFLYEVHKEDDRVRYTYHGLIQLLEEAGFTVEDISPTVGDLDHAEGYIVRARK